MSTQHERAMAHRIACAMHAIRMKRTAGEVRFVKDDGSIKRAIPPDFTFSPKAIKPLTKVIWSLSVALGHMINGSNRFNRIKSISISPDGLVGGKGYVQKIPDMRKHLSDAIETVTAIIDTLHDEITADHWQDMKKQTLSDKDRKEVQDMLSDSEDILMDPDSLGD
jgi:hypothetical protein